jgi:glycosyltransferase involved in cell wall biosynthesis
MCDLSDDDIAAVAARHDGISGRREVRSVVWFLPEFDSPFYGGINTALRLADFLRSEHGVENRFCFIAGHNEPWFRSALRASFPGLADAKMAFYSGFTDGDFSEVVALLGHADCAVATIWHTAYTVAAYPGADRSFYLVQDFEPGFYPNGTLFALAEESYKLGLYGLCNSPTMGKIYRERYEGVGRSFLPAVDTSVFHPPVAGDTGEAGDTAEAAGNPERPLRVFLYARPGHWRNCWELASAAIAQVKQRHPDSVHFVSAGSWARPNDLDLGIEQLGLLEYASTGDLYRTCDIGIALTVSEHPSYLPLELTACGVPVVAFDLPAGYWILKDGENSLLARRTIGSLAEKLERLVTDHELRQRLSMGATANAREHHSSWTAAFGDLYGFLCDPEAAADVPSNSR